MHYYDYYAADIGFPAKRPATMYVHNNSKYIFDFVSKNVKHGGMWEYPQKILPGFVGKILVSESNMALIGPVGDITYRATANTPTGPTNIFVQMYYDHPYGHYDSHYYIQATPPNIVNVRVDNEKPKGHSQTVNFYISDIKNMHYHGYY